MIRTASVGASPLDPHPPSDRSLLGVLAQTPYPPSVASARVRVANFTAFLEPHGVDLRYVPTLTEADYRIFASSGKVIQKSAALGRATAMAAISRSSGHDLLLVHRLRLLNPLPGFDPPRRLDVYDIDDPLFVEFSGGVNRRFRWTKREATRCIECLRRARLVLVGNRFLADRAREYARTVEILPSCIDPTEQPLHDHREQSPAVVGWIGSPTTTPYLQSVLPVIAGLNRGIQRVKLRLVGADASFTAPWIEHHPWSGSTERELLATFDIGIMPQPDDEWARGKCGYKVLQYFAAGVPAVASPVGVTPDLLDGGRGLLARTPEDWHRALVSLIEDPLERAERGAAARSFVESNFSYQRWAPELAALLRSLTA